MPVEIKELIVKTTVDNSQTTQNSKNGGGTANISEIKNQIIDECVYKIMEQLKKNNDR